MSKIDHGATMKGRVFISFGGPDRVIVDEAGKRWNFEMHHYCGPIATDKKGDPLRNEPPPKSSFWRVVSWWAQQGQQIDADGLCIWKKPDALRYVHVAGRHYRLASKHEAADIEVPQ